MANCYTDGTGTIRLKKITPVIKSIFGAFGVRPYEDGVAYIQRETEGAQANYADVVKEMAGESVDLYESDHIREEIVSFADKHGKRAEVETLIESFEFDPDGAADLAFLFDLAQIIDDGHEIKEIHFEEGWHGDQMRVGYFGGFGEFITKNVQVGFGSGQAKQLGKRLDAAVASGDIDAVSHLLRAQFSQVIDGISDKALRAEVMAKLLQDAPSPVAAPQP